MKSIQAIISIFIEDASRITWPARMPEIYSKIQLKGFHIRDYSCAR